MTWRNKLLSFELSRKVAFSDIKAPLRRSDEIILPKGNWLINDMLIRILNEFGYINIVDFKVSGVEFGFAKIKQKEENNMANQLIVFMKVEDVLEFRNDKGQLVAKALSLGDVENTFKEFDKVHASIPMELDTEEAKSLYKGKFIIYKADKVRYPKSNKTENGWKSDKELVLRGSVALTMEAEHVKMIVQPNFPAKFKTLMDEGVFNQS